jgi:hypothetical protein
VLALSSGGFVFKRLCIKAATAIALLHTAAFALLQYALLLNPLVLSGFAEQLSVNAIFG